MDIGCLDIGCLDIGCSEKHKNSDDSDSKEIDSNDLRSSISKSAKKSPRGTNQSSLNALNKFTTQIKKPPHRKNSPINWFPRKKVDSYLKRKIKMLQEVDGMNLTLDETLGDTNPHYSRVLREKIAAREAAHKAMEARKAALVEASWCRILKAARIQRKEADELLLQCEEAAAEAFKAATAMGVIMYDKPNCPQKHCEIETSSVNGGKSTTHKVTASFESAFEVDKQVAAAVKTAFIKLQKCPSFNKEEFKELLHKISENPDTSDGNQEISEFSSECESESGSEIETVSRDNDLDIKTPVVGLRQKKSKWKQSPEKFTAAKLVDIMFERLKSLQEDELSSLATIVATCGLSAALAETEVGKTHCPNSNTVLARRISSAGVGTTRNEHMEDGSMRKKQMDSELPSLDKFLVKHMSKLEKEVQEAKNMTMKEIKETEDGKVKVDKSTTQVETDAGTGLESFLVKRHSSKMAKEIEEAKKNSGNTFESLQKDSKRDVSEVPSLDKVLVKHMSKLEREVQEAKNMRMKEIKETEVGKVKADNKSTTQVETDAGSTGLESFLVKRHSSKLAKEIEEAKKNSGNTFESLKKNSKRDVSEVPSLDKVLVRHVSRFEKEVQEAKCRRNNDLSINRGLAGKENVNLNKEEIKNSEVSNESNRGTQETIDSLDKILAKPVHRLEREKMDAERIRNNNVNTKPQQRQGGNSNISGESLDKVLVKHVSRLEKEKMRYKASEEATMLVKRVGGNNSTHSQMNAEGGLDQVLVKHKSRLEREKMAASSEQKSEVEIRTSFLSRREARERELQEAWGGLSLGNSIRPHLSRLEKEKADWTKAEEEERMQAAA